MTKHKKMNSLSDLGLVFSTGDFQESGFTAKDPSETCVPEKQSPRIYLDRKKRKGKSVTIIAHLEECQTRLNELSKLFKTKCGVGGSVKDGEIIIQGDQRDKILNILLGLGYKNTKKAG